jgi:hypothetical protein
MIIQPIVEGQGDEVAVPLLLRRLRDEAQAWGLDVGRPHRKRRTHLNPENAYRRGRSFRRLVSAFGALATAAGVAPAVWPPAAWVS